MQVVLNRLDEHQGELCYDSETSGLDWRYNHICGHVITFGPAPADSYYIPVRHAPGGNVGGVQGPSTPTGWNGELARGEKELLSRLFRQGRKIIGHNLSFDLKFVYRLIGTRAFEPQFEDTMINEPLIDEFAKGFSLDACCLRYGVQAKKGQAIYDHIHNLFPEVPATKNAMGHFWRLAGDDPMAVEYATGDGTSTWQLRDAQRKQIEEQKLTVVHDIESRLIRVLARMTCKGIKVDVEYFEALKKRLDDQIIEMLNEFPDPTTASAQAPSDVRWYMEKHGVTDWPMTPKTKKPSFPEEWLEKSEPGQRIVAIRRVTHMRNSFINPLLEEHIWNGRVHSNFNQLRNDEFGTITGRLSCDSPNLQQAHKRDVERGRMLRGGFIPDEGMLFGEADISQCEPRLLAYYSRCKVLLEGYRAKPSVDAHTAVAVAMYKDWESWDSKTRKLKRENSKRVNQTLISGGGKGAIVRKYKVDPNEVNKLWNDYFRPMPEIRQLQKRAALRMRQRGYVVSLLGRRAQLRDGRDYIAINRLLQCGNADLIKAFMVAIDDYLESEGRPPVDMLNSIHDALDFQFHPDYRNVYSRCLEYMTDLTPGNKCGIVLDVPFEIEAGEGKTWAEATFGAK